MPPPPSTARIMRREHAFKALDALDKKALYEVSAARAAALAGTSVTYVYAWAEMRGYAHIFRRGSKAR